MQKICFICGASRSGTTLLTNLLDGHPDNFMLPWEVRILEYWNYHKSNHSLERFFRRDYLNTSDVLFFIDDSIRQEHEKYMRERYSIKQYFTGRLISKEDFIEEYRKTLSECGLSLQGVYRALFRAALLSDEDGEKRKVIVEKRPFDNEICAMLLADTFPDATFIHIIRDPRTRYISAKMRRVYRKFGILPAYARRLNGKDFATAHSEISMTSLELARLNRNVLGRKYHIVSYENLVRNPGKEMRAIADHLDIEFTECLLRQTSYREEVGPASSIEGNMGMGIKDVGEKRLRVFYENTSENERMILYLFIAEIGRYFGYESELIERMRSRDVMKPLKYEFPGDYLWNRDYMMRHLRERAWVVRERHFHEIVNKFEKGIPTPD